MKSESEHIWSAPPLSARAKHEAIGIRRDYDGQMRRRQWDDKANDWAFIECDVHISSDPIAPGVPAVGWNKIEAQIHRRQAMIDRVARTRRAQPTQSANDDESTIGDET